MVVRDKKKDFAPGSAAFYPLGADLFLSSRKIDHIARFIQIPSINVPGDVPSILIVNIQVAAYFLFKIELELRVFHPYWCKIYVRNPKCRVSSYCVIV